MKEQAQLLAVVGIPQRSIIRKHINCGILVFCRKRDGDVHFEEVKYECGYCPRGLQIEGFADEEAMFERFWANKAGLVKGCEWINQREVHQSLIDEVLRIWRHYEFDVSNCLVRFDACFPVDPYHGFFTGIESHSHDLDHRWRMHRILDLHYTKVTYDHWVEKWRPIVAELPVLPVKYRILHRHGLCVPKRMSVVLNRLGRILGDRLFTREWHLRIKALGVIQGDLPQQKTATVKSIRRATKRGAVMTKKAQAWFRKFHAISLLGGWARREEKARQQRQTKGAIS